LIANIGNLTVTVAVGSNPMKSCRWVGLFDVAYVSLLRFALKK